jgi:hypothetical protein
LKELSEEKRPSVESISGGALLLAAYPMPVELMSVSLATSSACRMAELQDWFGLIIRKMERVTRAAPKNPADDNPDFIPQYTTRAADRPPRPFTVPTLSQRPVKLGHYPWLMLHRERIYLRAGPVSQPRTA